MNVGQKDRGRKRKRKQCRAEQKQKPEPGLEDKKESGKYHHTETQERNHPFLQVTAGKVGVCTNLGKLLGDGKTVR